MLGKKEKSNESIVRAIKEKDTRKIKKLLEGITHLKLSYDGQRFFQMGTEGMQYLATALENNQTIKYIDISGNSRIRSQGLQHLLKTLQNNSVSHLILGGAQIDSLGMQYLKEFLEKNQILEHLSISNNPVRDDGANYISELLKQNQSLKYLDISGDTRMSDKGVSLIIKSLRTNNTLQTINVNGVSIGNITIKQLIKVVDCNSTLNNLSFKCATDLELSNIKELCEALKKNRTITHLYFNASFLIFWAKLEIVKYFAEILKNNFTITHLTLKFSIGKVGLSLLAEALQSNIALVYFRYEMDCDSRGLLEETKIWKILNRNKFIADQSLNFKANEFCNEFVWNNLKFSKTEIMRVCSLLRSNLPIKKLDLSNNNLNDELIQDLNDALQFNTSLIDINFSRNRIAYEGAKALIKATRNNSVLKKIDLTYNYVDVGTTFFNKLCKPEKHTNRTFEIDISMNYVGHECKTLLKTHGIFKTKASISNSIITTEKRITKNNWLVFILRDNAGDSQHAMIVIEGVRDYGQQFIEMHDFRPINTSPKKGQVKTTYYNPERTLRRVSGYEYICFPMLAIKAKKLRRFINADKNKRLGYSKLCVATKSRSESHNCLTWVITKLQQVGLEVKEPLFVAVPSLYISGQNIQEPTNKQGCSVM